MNSVRISLILAMLLALAAPVIGQDRYTATEYRIRTTNRTILQLDPNPTGRVAATLERGTELTVIGTQGRYLHVVHEDQHLWMAVAYEHILLTQPTSPAPASRQYPPDPSPILNYFDSLPRCEQEILNDYLRAIGLHIIATLTDMNSWENADLAPATFVGEWLTKKFVFAVPLADIDSSPAQIPPCREAIYAYIMGQHIITEWAVAILTEQREPTIAALLLLTAEARIAALDAALGNPDAVFISLQDMLHSILQSRQQ